MKGEQITSKIFKLLDSTNSEAKRLAAMAQPEIWLLALKQTAGRGRRGRKWLSGDQDFTASLLTYPKIPENQFSLLSYVAGIAFYEAVLKLGVSNEALLLKWPNDLLLNGKKIGGILLERATTLPSGEKPLVIGFGLNLVSSPSIKSLDKSALIPDSLKTGSSILCKPQEFFTILMASYKTWSDIFFRNGFLDIRASFLERTTPIGQRIKVKTINNTSYGSFFGINNNGSLILDTSTGTVLITAGDIFLVGD